MTVIVTAMADNRIPGALRVRLGASDIAFGQIATFDTRDRPEDSYPAVRFSPNPTGHELACRIWDHPVGVLNDCSSEPLNGAKIISDFEFEIELDRED